MGLSNSSTITTLLEPQELDDPEGVGYITPSQAGSKSPLKSSPNGYHRIEMGENDEEFESRKYKIKKFKDKNSDCMVLVANYASCAEGISLHHVCHNAIYIDRSFQADQYLQSVDRICRLGNNDEKNIIILQNKIPETLKNIDLAVNHALQRKIENMGRFLNDPDLVQMSLNESEGIQPIDENISNSDLQDIINQFLI